MEKDDFISEVSKDILKNLNLPSGDTYIRAIINKLMILIAENLYNAGYRKINNTES